MDPRFHRVAGNVSGGRVVRRGFTLIEVMIVIAIILALATLVAVTLFSQRDKATKQIAQVQMRGIKGGMELFRLDFNRYPTEEETVEVLWNKDLLDPDADTAVWKQYLEEAVPKDQWGNEWGYETLVNEENSQPGYKLWSNGPDGEEGTDDDIMDGKNLPSEETEGLGDSPTGGTGG